MLFTKKHTAQFGLLYGLTDLHDQKYPLYQLATKINWLFFDDVFKKHNSEKMGKPPPLLVWRVGNE